MTNNVSHVTTGPDSGSLQLLGPLSGTITYSQTEAVFNNLDWGYDFGDAPTGYLTLLGEVDGSGRRAPYSTLGNIYMGSSVTREPIMVFTHRTRAGMLATTALYLGMPWNAARRCRLVFR